MKFNHNILLLIIVLSAISVAGALITKSISGLPDNRFDTFLKFAKTAYAQFPGGDYTAGEVVCRGIGFNSGYYPPGPVPQCGPAESRAHTMALSCVPEAARVMGNQRCIPGYSYSIGSIDCDPPNTTWWWSWRYPPTGATVYTGLWQCESNVTCFAKVICVKD